MGLVGLRERFSKEEVEAMEVSSLPVGCCCCWWEVDDGDGGIDDGRAGNAENVKAGQVQVQGWRWMILRLVFLLLLWWVELTR